MKDPAFLFYPNDYLGGTMGMTFEEKGAYIELLMVQFNRGHMTIDMIGHIIGQNGGQLWDKIKDKFEIDKDGNYYNVRLEEEQNKRKAFTASRKNNLKGTNQYTKKKGHKGGHMSKHMEDENENENKDINKDENIVIYDFETLKKEILIEGEWMEGVAKNYSISIKTLKSKLKIFLKEQELTDNTIRTLQDLKKHFFYYMKKEKTINNKNADEVGVNLKIDEEYSFE